MLQRFFPKTISNAYRGHAIAIWLLVAVALSKLVMGSNSIVNTRFVIEVADQIPLSGFSASAGAALIFLYKCWGLGLALLSLLALVAVVRYRAMIPLMYLVLTLEQVARQVFTLVDPPRAAGNPSGAGVGSVINLVFVALLLVGLALSLGQRNSTRPRRGRVGECGCRLYNF